MRENAKPSHCANCSRAGSADTPASTSAKSLRTPKGETMILAAMRRPGRGAISASVVRANLGGEKEVPAWRCGGVGFFGPLPPPTASGMVPLCCSS